MRLTLTLLALGAGALPLSAQTFGTAVHFSAVSTNVAPGAVWKLDAPIEVLFDAPIDFATVNANTIRIRSALGVPVAGTFSLLAPAAVRFQPACPTAGDLSDLAFEPGEPYRLEVPDVTGGGLTVQSTTGASLQSGLLVRFQAAGGATPGPLFLGASPGPPQPVLRVAGSADRAATHLELGGDPSQRVYLETDPLSGALLVPAGMPTNLFSDLSSALALVLELDEPVDPSAANLALLRLEAERTPGTWSPVTADASLVQNCAGGGATIRLQPREMLPQDRRVRAVLGAGFVDLSGDAHLLDAVGFAEFDIESFSSPGLPAPADHADELLEGFDDGTWEDDAAAFGEVRAEWGGGYLSAPFAFDGTGGPGGDFDFLVPAGTTILLDTVSSTVTGGPLALLGVNSTIQQVQGGLLQVRDLRIEAGGVLIAIGPNPLLVRATGTVEILGDLDVGGSNAKSVSTLNTGHLPEPGAAGRASGGRGGTASYLTTTSTPMGLPGSGAYDVPGLGGQGGESGYGPGSKNNRRPGGGGGGAFGPSAGVGVGLTAEPGHDGGLAATGAVTGLMPPQGGAAGVGPFVDGDPTNDFWGTRFDALLGTVVEGELAQPHAGAGGGAGGDAVPGTEFPASNWTPAHDEKGCGGGGAAGQADVRALVSIRVGATGRVLAVGGDGGSGENTIFNDHVGGGSGGASGGHLILMAPTIDLASAAADALDARGGLAGQGAAGVDSTNAGGDGGPGVIQLHHEALLLPPGQALADLTVPDAHALVPMFGSEARARSLWIPVRHAADAPGGGTDPIAFRFAGTDPLTGQVLELDQDGVVDALPPLLGPSALAAAPALPHLGRDPREVVLDATPLVGTLDDIYLRNPALLREFSVRLAKVSNSAFFQGFDVSAAQYDARRRTLRLTVDAGGPALAGFAGGAPATVALVPRNLRVETQGLPDFLPTNHAVRVLWQGAGETPLGAPDEGSPLTGWIGDAAQLSQPGVAFYRFEVVFELGPVASQFASSSSLPTLDFLRLPFRF